MPELNFCPYCNASSHKVIPFEDNQHFCKACNKFFSLDFVQMFCPKCQSKRYSDSDFPTPDGQIVIQCKSCKKMFSLKEFIDKNKALPQPQ